MLSEVRLRAIFISLYFIILALIQTQWTFYLIVPFMFISVIGVMTKAKGWRKNTEEIILSLIVLTIGVFARLSLDSFDNITTLDDLIFDHSLWAVMFVAIPIALVSLAKLLTKKPNIEQEFNH